MGLEKQDRPFIDDELNQTISELQKKKLTIIADTRPRETGIYVLFKKIPLLKGFLEGVDHTGLSLSKLANIEADVAQALQGVASVPHFGAISAVIDFFRIPLLALHKDSPPITYTKKAKWLYSAATVGLVSVGIALPVVAAPIAVAIASMVFVYSIASIVMLYRRRKELKKLLDGNRELIEEETNLLHRRYEETKSLEDRLQKAMATKNNEKEIATLKQMLHAKSEEFDVIHQHLQQLHNETFQYQQDLNKLGTDNVVFKSLAIALSAVMVTGFVLAFFFPPLGLALVAASAAVGGVLIIGRVISKIIQARKARKIIKQQAKNKAASSKEEHDLSLDHALKNTNTATKAHADNLHLAQHAAPHFSSGFNILQMMGGVEHPREELKQIEAREKSIQTMASLLSHSIADDSMDKKLKGVLAFFSHAVQHINANNASTNTTGQLQDLQQLLMNFDKKDLKKAWSILKESIVQVNNGAIKLTEDENKLLSSSPLLLEFSKMQPDPLDLDALKIIPDVSPDNSPEPPNNTLEMNED